MRTAAAIFVAVAIAAAVCVPSSTAGARERAETPPISMLRALKWRSIGPANMGGRITDLAVIESQPSTIYVAYATGGIFKTTNFGTTWSTVFDDQPVASVGAVAVWQQDPSVVWAGTGEANSRNSSSWGNGVYVSRDAGASWTHAGLERTHSIGRVVLHPADSNVVYVAALGRLWGENPERGVFKTADGGRTWQHVLKVDARTGAVDLVMDPSDPNVLYAAMYARKRSPWSYEAGGTTGGIFRTKDGGRTWTKLRNGLPEVTGRIGLDLYRANPKTLFAVIESTEGGRIERYEAKSRVGGVFRSADGGDTWERLSPYTPRPFYFSQIRVDPRDERRLYLLGVDLWISDDGGRTFRARGGRNLHPDFHALWVEPARGEMVITGTDGGLYVSHDRAKNWDYVNNMAVGQFYNIGVDMRDPYHVYGGLQDNQNWGGPSRTKFQIQSWLDDTGRRGILNDDWYCLGGGDGFHVAVDPGDSNIVYFESQGGRIRRVDLASGVMRVLQPSANEGEPRFRFNWNTPFTISPHDPTVLWLGGNHVFRLEERGNRWRKASPDLTTADPRKMVTEGSTAENHCTITTLAESPREPGLLWVGTDDGKVWLGRGGGETWTDLSANLRGLPRNLYMSRIEASHHDPGTAYLAVDGHRSDDVRPWLFATRDFGRTWTSITGNLPADAPVKVVREDPANPHLLFAGTEFGIWMTTDGGRRWVELDLGLPTVAVDDIVIHPRERDLVIGTHGRSIWILDDVTPLEQWDAAAARSPVTLFEPREALAFHARTRSGVWGQRMWTADNPPLGAYLNYLITDDENLPVSLEISDANGRRLRKLSGPGSKGLHRVVWDLQIEPGERIDRPEWADQPEFVPPGTYSVKLTRGRGAAQTKSFSVRHAPGTRPAED